LPRARPRRTAPTACPTADDLFEPIADWFGDLMGFLADFVVPLAVLALILILALAVIEGSKAGSFLAAARGAGEGVLGVAGLALLAVLLAVFLRAAGWLFWLPTRVAEATDHPNQVAIAAVNLLFGWTFLGWGIALVWALTHSPTSRT
jgi:hypothetical protein